MISNSNTDTNHLMVGSATATIQQNKPIYFEKQTDPILSVDGGGEMPCVFKHNNQWQMFYQHFNYRNGATWRHYNSKNLQDWSLADKNMFNGTGEGYTNLMLVRRLDATPQNPMTALVRGTDDGCLKLFAYNVESKS